MRYLARRTVAGAARGIPAGTAREGEHRVFGAEEGPRTEAVALAVEEAGVCAVRAGRAVMPDAACAVMAGLAPDLRRAQGRRARRGVGADGFGDAVITQVDVEGLGGTLGAEKVCVAARHLCFLHRWGPRIRWTIESCLARFTIRHVTCAHFGSISSFGTRVLHTILAEESNLALD